MKPKLPDFLIRCGQCAMPMKEGLGADMAVLVHCINKHCLQKGQNFAIREAQWKVESYFAINCGA